MAIYAGYAERNVDNEINWASIGKSMTDMLQNEAKLREDKKAAIDKASRDFGETLSNAPQGQHQGVNTWALNYANNAQQARLMQDRLLKSGRLQLKDYNVMRQNLTDGTSQALGLVKEYSAKAAEKMERMSKGLSAAQEQYEMEQIEGYGNFSSTELYINPTDAVVSVGKKVRGKDGVMRMSDNPNDFSSISSLKNQLNSKIDKFNVIGSLKLGVDALGKKTEVIMSNGVKTRKNPKNLAEYDKVKNTYLDSLMTNSVNVGSVLTDYVKVSSSGVPYGFTRDPENNDPSKILLVADPANPSSGRLVPSLTPKQEKAAKEALGRQFDAMIDEEDTARAEFAPQRAPQPTAYDKKMASIQERNLKSVDYMNRALSATSKEEVSAALGDLQSFNDNISKVEKVGNELVFSIYNPQRKQNEIQRVPLSGGKKDIAERALTKILGPDVNVTELIKDSGIGLSGNVSNIGGKYERTVEVQKAPLTAPASFVFDEATQSMQSPKTIFTDKIKDTATPEVAMATRELLNSQGIKAEVDITEGRRGFGAYISGKSKPGYVNIKFDESVVTLPDTVKDFKETMFNVINEINNASLENRKINKSLLSSLGAKIQPKKTLDF